MSKRIVIALVTLFGFSCLSMAQTSWVGGTNNKWSKDYNWTNGAPDQNTDAIIGDASFTGANQPELDKNGKCRSLTIGDAAKASVFEIRKNLEVHGDLIIGSNGTISSSVKKIITLEGDWINNGVYTVTHNGAKVTFSGANQIMSGATTFKKVEINHNSMLTLAADMTIENKLEVSGSIDPTANYSVGGAGDIDLKSQGTLKVMTANFAGNYPITGIIDLDKRSTVDYASTSITQYISPAYNYGQLRLSGGSTKELTADLPVLQDGNDNAGIIYLDAGVFDLKSYTANRDTGPGGHIILSAGTTLKIGSGSEFPQNFDTPTIASTSTVEYYGNNQDVEDVDYGNLVLTGTSGSVVKTMPNSALLIFGDFTATVGTAADLTFTAQNSIEVQQDISLGASVTFEGASYTHTFRGDWTNDGVFNGNTSRCDMRGTSALLSGSGTNDFHELRFRAAGITADGSTDLNVSGDLLFEDGGSFRHSDNGKFTISGAGSSITADGIDFFDLVITGSASTSSDITIRGDLDCDGSLTANSGILSLNGNSKTVLGPGTISLYRLDINGHITTADDITINNDLNVSASGSFSASAGTVTFDDTSDLSGEANLYEVSITAGKTLTLGLNSILGISDVLTLSGTLDCNSYKPNLVDYNGGSNQTVADNTYYDLTLSNGGIKTAKDDMIIKGDLTIGAGASFNADTYVIQIHRDWVNNGTFSAGTSDIQFISGKISNITGATTFNDFTVNKNTTESQAFLKSNVTASNIIMTTGLLDTESNSITTLGGRSGNGLIYGTVIHQHTFADATPYYFEGPQNSLTFNTPSGVTSVTSTCRPQEVTDFVPGLESIYREYDVSIVGGSYTDVRMKLHYEDNELNAFEEPFLSFYKHNTGLLWDSLGFTTRDLANNWVELTGITNGSGRYTLSGIRRVVEWNGSVSTAWEDQNNWTTVSGTDMSNRVPTNQDAIELGNIAFINQPTINNTEAISSITFGSARATTITMNNRLSVGGTIKGDWSSSMSHILNVGSSDLDVDLNLLMSDGTNGNDISLSIGTGQVTVGNDLIQSGQASITFTDSGNLIVSGDYDYTSGVFTPGTGTMTYSGDHNQEVAPLTYNNLSFTKTNEAACINSPTVVTGDLNTLIGGEVLCSDSLTVDGDISIGFFTTLLEEDAHIIVGGDWTNQGTFTPSTGSVRFSGLSNQTVDGGLFSDLIIDKSSGELTLAGDIFIEGDFDLLDGTVDLLTYQADRTNSGGSLTLTSGTTLKVGGADNFPNLFVNNSIGLTSLVEYNGTMAQTIASGIDYGYLTLSNGTVNTKQINEDASILNDLSIGSNATLELGAIDLMIYGDITNLGSVIPNQSVVLLEGTGKTITGPIDFHSLDVDGSYTVASGTTTMTGDFYVETTGTINFGNNDAILDGDLTNKGSIISNGTATFTGTQVQSIQLLNAISSSSTGVINFNGTVAPFINSTSSPSFATVNINNTGGITPSVPWAVFVQLNVAAGASFNGGPLTHTFYSGFDNQGTVTSSGSLVFNPGAPYSAGGTVNLGGTSFTSTGDVTFSGTAPLTLTVDGSPSFHDIVVSNQHASGVTAPQSWTVADEIDVVAGSTFHGGTGTTHSIGNSILNNGTIDGGTSEFSITGATASVNGIGSTTFHDLEIVSGAVLTLNKEISLTGDLANDGTFTTETGRNVRFTGTSQSVITGTTGSITFGEMESDKTGSSVVLSIPVTVEDQLTLTDGIISTDDTNILTLNDNALSDEGHATCYVDGPMQKTGDDAFIFPLGDNGKWARLGMSAPTATTDLFQAEFIDVFYADTSSMAVSPTPVLTNVSQHEYWNVDRVAGSSSISVELFWENAQASGINDFSDDLVVAHWNGSAWENAGQSAITGGNSGSVTSDPQSSFSPFTFGSKSLASNPLPIELLEFNARPEGPNVRLDWTTASEINNDYFTIERSRDAEFWEVVTELPGAGFSSELLHYEDLDFNPYPGISYYRLKSTDFDGTSEYSDIRSVNMNVGVDSNILIFPNPTEGMLTIIASEDEFKDFRISTMIGQDMTSLVQIIDSAATEHRVDLSLLKPGLYVLSLNSIAVKVYKK